VDAAAQSCDSTGSPYAPSNTPLPSSHAQRLRIIGGRHRGRVIRFPPIVDVRPTPDRVRETLFNWLGQDLTDRRTLDLYCGTGALSLEALSRGGALAVAVDRNPALIRALERTAGAIGMAGLEAHVADAETFLTRERRRFDVVFLDPPFDSDPWRSLLPRAMAALAPGGFVYAEAGRRIEPPPGAAVWRHARAGQVHYHLLRSADADAPPSS
jgi:16S rRNA (guanine(966)-N(2))-methyltransferase RsmD